MIRSWWAQNALREKLLIVTALGISLLLLLWFGGLNPLLQNRAEARLAYQSAQTDHAYIMRNIALLKSNDRGPGPASDNDSFRAEVTQIAQNRGLAIARIQSTQDGSVQLVFSDASPTEIYAWLQDLSSLPGGRAISASLTSDEEQVEAVIRLQGTMP